MRDLEVVGVILVIIIILASCAKYAYPKTDCTMTFFHRPGCGYCSRMYDQWDSFVSKAPKGIKTRKINIRDKRYNQLVAAYGVRSVPHIVKEKRGRRSVYKGPRKANDLLSYAIS